LEGRIWDIESFDDQNLVGAAGKHDRAAAKQNDVGFGQFVPRDRDDCPLPKRARRNQLSESRWIAFDLPSDDVSAFDATAAGLNNDSAAGH